MKIVVLCGGLSRERDVSITSGSMVYEALVQNGHTVLLLDLYLGWDQAVWGGMDQAFEQSCRTVGGEILEQAPDIRRIRAERGDENGLLGKHVLDICSRADIVFMALHGEEGENGKLQAAFDVAGVRYTGAGYLGSALAMNKSFSKRLFAQGGIQTPAGITVRKQDVSYDNMGFPCVVKPCSGGSSVGTSIVHSEQEYQNALTLAFEIEQDVIVEQYIRGREFSVGVLGDAALPVIEICPKQGFYDYKNKYQSGMTDEYCPADLDEAATRRVQQMALEVFDLLGLQVYARIDFMMDPASTFYCLEANTLPGMTPLSLLPQEAAAAGISYTGLCEAIIRESLKKYG